MALEEKANRRALENTDIDSEIFLMGKEILSIKNCGKCVAYSGGKLIDVADNHDELVEKTEGILVMYVEFVDEKAFEEPPIVHMPGLHSVTELKH